MIAAHFFVFQTLCRDAGRWLRLCIVQPKAVAVLCAFVREGGTLPFRIVCTVMLLNTYTEIFQVGSLCTLDATFETDFRAVSPFLHFPTGRGKRAFSATGNSLSLSRRRFAILQPSSFFIFNREHGFVLACQGAYQSKDFTFSSTSLSVQDCPRTICCYWLCCCPVQMVCP